MQKAILASRPEHLAFGIVLFSGIALHRAFSGQLKRHFSSKNVENVDVTKAIKPKKSPLYTRTGDKGTSSVS